MADEESLANHRPVNSSRSIQIAEPKLIGRQICSKTISTIDSNRQKFEYLEAAATQHVTGVSRLACLWSKFCFRHTLDTSCDAIICFVFCPIDFVIVNASKCSIFGPQMSFTRAQHLNAEFIWIYRDHFSCALHTPHTSTHTRTSIKCNNKMTK